MAIGDILLGAGTGAITGAAAGAPFGGAIGAGIGAGVGALTGGFAAGRGGLTTKEKLSKFERFSPEQLDLISQLRNALTGQGGFSGGILGDLLGQDGIGASAIRQFHEHTVPGIAERFSGLGAGAQSSSAFQQSLGAAGAGLSERLASMQSQQQLGLLGPLLSAILAPQQDQFFQPSGPSGFAKGISGLLGGLGQGIGQYGASKLSDYFANKAMAGAQ